MSEDNKAMEVTQGGEDEKKSEQPEAAEGQKPQNEDEVKEMSQDEAKEGGEAAAAAAVSADGSDEDGLIVIHVKTPKTKKSIEINAKVLFLIIMKPLEASITRWEWGKFPYKRSYCLFDTIALKDPEWASFVIQCLPDLMNSVLMIIQA